MSKDTGGPAFPTEPNTQKGVYAHHGMTLRDWFAGQIMAAQAGGLVSAQVPSSAEDVSGMAHAAYRAADAMLAARMSDAELAQQVQP